MIKKLIEYIRHIKSLYEEWYLINTEYCVSLIIYTYRSPRTGLNMEVIKLDPEIEFNDNSNNYYS